MIDVLTISRENEVKRTRFCLPMRSLCGNDAFRKPRPASKAPGARLRGGMSQPEDNPPTLASLRAGRGKPRSIRRSSPPQPTVEQSLQTGLFAAFLDTTPPPIEASNPPQE